MRRIAGWLTVCTVFLAGCSLITGVSNDRQVGAIGYPDNLLISAPDSVMAGQLFTVTVRTFGSDGCWRDDGTEVGIRGLTATVTPYDNHRTSRGTACTQAVIEITHNADLQFELAGQATIEFRGRNGTATRTVAVR